jgi:hypothetical protein
MATETVKDVWTTTIPMDAFDTLTAKLKILEVNLMMIHGSGFDGFQDHPKEVQDTYLWGCYTLARECNELAQSK